MHRTIRGASLFSVILGLGLAAAPASADIQIKPYAAVAGGLKGEFSLTRPGVTREPRATTLAVSRFGLRADLADWIYAESEFEANAGLHGTSTWEGQAAFQVRNQLLRLYGARWKVEVGRVTDEASVDFFSAHVADMLLTDSFTRDPFLFSGFNRGNGVLGTYELLPGLRAGLTLNAANPVATTGSLVIGGTYPPFERFYLVPYQAVNQGPNHFPDDTFHIMIVTPSLLYRSERVEARAAFQGYVVNTDTTRLDDANIWGFNARANVQLKLLEGKLLPFLNLSFDRNDMLDPSNLRRRVDEKYTALTFGGGVDFNYSGRNGVGVQYMRISLRQGQGVITALHYANIGTTYWLTPAVSIGGRLAFSQKHELAAGTPDEGERAAFLTLRALL